MRHQFNLKHLNDPKVDHFELCSGEIILKIKGRIDNSNYIMVYQHHDQLTLVTDFLPLDHFNKIMTVFK